MESDQDSQKLGQKKKKKAILVISELGKQRQVALWGLLTQPAQLIQQITNPVSETNQTGF